MAVNNVLFPIEPPPAELDISEFAGSEKVTHKGVICRGDRSGAQDVFERCIAFVQRYSQTLVGDDIAAAYATSVVQAGDSGARENAILPNKYLLRPRHSHGSAV